MVRKQTKKMKKNFSRSIGKCRLLIGWISWRLVTIVSRSMVKSPHMTRYCTTSASCLDPLTSCLGTSLTTYLGTSATCLGTSATCLGNSKQPAWPSRRPACLPPRPACIFDIFFLFESKFTLNLLSRVIKKHLMIRIKE